ncbi:MAG TPA: glycosyltransferase [Verrucomicrobiota bacterium]|nr:glycosyltransferase [Verrucomicrobiota bacterium]
MADDADKPSVEIRGGVVYHALPRPRGSRVLGYLKEAAVFRDWLAERSRSHPPESVILSGPYSRMLAFILPLSRQLRIACVPDLVEWFSIAAQVRKRGMRGWLDVVDVQAALRYGIARTSGVIAISRYLEEHCRQLGVPALRVPPLIDTQDAVWSFVENAAESEQLRLLFMGTFRRDRMDLLLNGIAEARRRGARVRLEFLGSSREEFCEWTGMGERVEALGSGIHFFGRVPREQVAQIAVGADFAVLLRDDARWSRACFPSKLVELAAVGVPMLCNLTSDLSLYLKDGVNSIVVPRLNSVDVVSALERASALSRSQRLCLRRGARQMAETEFDYRHFSASMHEFLLRVTSRCKARVVDD